MKKLIFFLSSLIFLNFAFPVRGFDFFEKDFENFNEEPLIFSNPDFTNATYNFNPGQTIYIRVVNGGSGSKERLIRILDNTKKEVQRLTLSRSENGQYIYTASLEAPGQPGIYYIDIKIEGDGSSFASQENINVGQTDSSTSVSSEAKSIVSQGNKLKPTKISIITPTIAPTEKPEASKELPISEKPISFISRLFESLRRLFSRLAR